MDILCDVVAYSTRWSVGDHTAVAWRAEPLDLDPEPGPCEGGYSHLLLT